MASKVKKGFLYYLAWFAFICLGIVCIFATILVFNPSKDIFGINLCYISQKYEKEYKYLNINNKNVDLKDLNLEHIVVTTKSSDVKIVSDNYIDQLTIRLESKITGFAKYSNFEDYKATIKHSNNTLSVDVKESIPSLAFSNISVVEIICPKAFNLSNSNLTVNTVSGNFSMGASKQLPSRLKSLTINSKDSYINLKEYSYFSSGNVTINTTNLNTHINCDIPGNLNIIANSGKLKLNAISGNMNLTSNSIEARCNTILGNVFYSCDDGFINIGTIGSMSNPSSFTSSQETEISNVKIKNLYGDIAIPNGNKSDIIVENIHGEALIKTTSGNVRIGKGNGNISVTTTTGSVKITQTNANAITAINTSSGNIIANFVEVGDVNIVSKKGKVYINVATDKPFVLDYETGRGIKVSFIEKKLEKTGTLLIATEEDNGKLMKIKTNNSVSIKNGFTLEN